MSAEQLPVNVAHNYESVTQQAANFIEKLGDSHLIIESVKEGAPWPLTQPRGNLFEKSDALISALGAPIQQAFVSHNMTDDAATLEALALLGEHKPAFVELATNKLAPIMEFARMVFGVDSIGLALRTKQINEPIEGQNYSLLYGIPALQRDNVTHRLLINPAETKLPILHKAFGVLALPTEFDTTAGAVLAITEIVPDAEEPKDFSEAETEDWLTRLKASGVKLNNDFHDKNSVMKDDKGLDNFLRLNGKLYWCDGDLMNVQPIDAESMAQQIEEWRQLMQSFMRPEVPAAA